MQHDAGDPADLLPEPAAVFGAQDEKVGALRVVPEHRAGVPPDSALVHLKVRRCLVQRLLMQHGGPLIVHRGGGSRYRRLWRSRRWMRAGRRW